MTKTVRYCDVCGSDGALEFTYFTERKMDAAGDIGSAYESIDICHLHAINLLAEYDKQTNRTPILNTIENLRHERMGRKPHTDAGEDGY